MRRCAELVLMLSLALAAPALGDTRPADCALLTGALQAIPDYRFTAPPAADAAGWCVLDLARLTTTRPDRPIVSARRMRLRGLAEGDRLVALEAEIAGLRVLPKAGDREMDDRLRAMFRLQEAELRLSVAATPEGLEVETLDIRLSGGTELRLGASLAGAELDRTRLMQGRVTRLAVEWRNDGRLLRPVMELAGEALVDGAEGGAAVDAARLALRHLVGNLPETLFAEGGRRQAERLVAALPQGRGRLTLLLADPDGIGAALLALAVLSGDPWGPEALARLFSGSRLELDWQPGLPQ